MKPRTFIRAEQLPGSGAAVRNALSRAAGRGEIVRIRSGLYYRGASSRYGLTRPSTAEIALLEVLRDPATFVESGWAALESAVIAVIAAIKVGKLRLAVLDDVVPKEGPLATRRNFAELRKILVEV